MKVASFTCISCGREFQPVKDPTHNAQNWSAWKTPVRCPHCKTDNTTDFLLFLLTHKDKSSHLPVEDWYPDCPYTEEDGEPISG